MSTELFFYRYEDVQYAPPPDEYGDCYGIGDLKVHLRTYTVIKRTLKGTVIDIGVGDRKFILRNATKHFACPTVEEAMISFLARKRRQISIHQAVIDRANRAIKIIQKGPFYV